MGNTEDLHIGKMIRQTLRKQGRSVTWLAKELNCCRTNMYLIFQKSHLDTALLLRISHIMGYNFFADVAKIIESNDRL